MKQAFFDCWFTRDYKKNVSLHNDLRFITMSKNQKDSIKIFEDRKVRSVWDAETEKWYISIVDVVGVLTESSNPNNY
jgi:hypothetical protein